MDATPHEKKGLNSLIWSQGGETFNPRLDRVF